MALDGKTLKVCNCNRTMALDAKALASALELGAPVAIHSELCRKEVASFTSALKDGECVVACTQESPLFSELATQAGSSAQLHFVNIRETAGWSAEGKGAMPKIAALLALADIAEPEPVPGVSYASGGNLLIVGPVQAAIAWAERLRGQFGVGVLVTDCKGGDLPSTRSYPVWSGRVSSIRGWLGAFEVSWEQENPIDLEVCTRCNACIRACPENAIDFTYQIDLERCKAHRECVKACAQIGAIDFSRADRARSEKFDLVLDLSLEPAIRTPQLPQGYRSPGPDPLEQALAAGQLAQLVGEFEKPKFFAYNEKICAHGRSGKTGCTRCIDTCSTGAISSDGDRIRVESHLCQGCGGCATVCPSGAISYAYPRVPDLGSRVKKLLTVYRRAGGSEPGLLFHGGEGRELIARLARKGRGLPARVIPMEVLHPASIGIDTMLGAIAWGATQVLLLASETENAEYGEAVRAQIAHAQAVLHALGYEGEHFAFFAPDSAASLENLLWALEPAGSVGQPATFNLVREKRTSLEFAIEHLAKQAPAPRDEIDLAEGAPWGRVNVNRDTCTLCMACIGACPEGALLDTAEMPRLRFIERNCVQCGLCVNTCPEGAVTLTPRLLLTGQAKEAVTLNDSPPFHCIRCGKPFGTRHMIEVMTGRLSTHSMFTGSASLKRLQMCADCRVIDMMENKDEASIFDVKR